MGGQTVALHPHEFEQLSPNHFVWQMLPPAAEIIAAQLATRSRQLTAEQTPVIKTSNFC